MKPKDVKAKNVKMTKSEVLLFGITYLRKRTANEQSRNVMAAKMKGILRWCWIISPEIKPAARMKNGLGKRKYSDRESFSAK